MQLYDMPIEYTLWMQAILLCVLLIISALQPQTLAYSLNAVSAPIQRRYTMSIAHPVVNWLKKIFVLCTMALSMSKAIMAYTGSDAAITWRQWLLSIAIMAGVWVVQIGIEQWIQTTFRLKVNPRTFRACRSDLWLLVNVGLWIGWLFSPWMSDTVQWVLPLALVAIGVGILWWKIMQLIGWTIQTIIFTSLYIVHAYWLPLAIGILCAQQLQS